MALHTEHWFPEFQFDPFGIILGTMAGADPDTRQPRRALLEPHGRGDRSRSPVIEAGAEQSAPPSQQSAPPSQPLALEASASQDSGAQSAGGVVGGLMRASDLPFQAQSEPTDEKPQQPKKTVGRPRGCQ